MLSRRPGFGFLVRTALAIALVAGTVSMSIARPNPAHAEDRSEPQLTAEYIDRIVEAVEDNREPYRKLLGDELLTETVEYLTAIRDYTDLLTSANESAYPGVWAAASALNDCLRAIEDSSEGFTREKAEWLIEGFEDLGTAIDVVTLLPFGKVGEFIGSVATWHVFAELVKTAYGQAWEWLEYFAWHQDNFEIRDRIWENGFLQVQIVLRDQPPVYKFVQTQLGDHVNSTLPQIQFYLGDFGTASDPENLFFRYSLVSRNLDTADYWLVFVFEGRYTYYNNASLRIRFGDYMSWATLIESAPFSVSSPDANWELITDIPRPLIDNAPTSQGILQLTLYHDNTMCETLNLPFILNTGGTTAPVVDHGPTVTCVEAGSAVIDWTTNEESSSRVDYGTTVGYGPKEIDPDMTTEHSVVLSGLDDTVDYHFKVRSSDRSGNTYVSQDFSFRLTDLIDTTPPAFSEGPEVLSTTASSAVIRWSNDEPTTGTLEYGIDPGLGGMKQDPTFRYDHEGVVIYNLTPETDYFGRVTSVDRAGNQSTSAVFTFGTLSAATEPRLLLEKQETIGGPNEADVHIVSVNQSGKLEISVTGVPGINMMAYLFRNPTDTVAIASGGYSSLFGQQASLVPVYIDPSQVGAYYIKVFDYAGNDFSQTPYTITAAFTPRDTVYFLDEPNDASNQPTSLGLNQPYQSYIYRPTHASPSDYGNNYGGDTDWYQLSLTQAGKLEISVTAVPGINMMAELFRNPTDGAIASGGYSSLFGQSASLVPVYIDPSQVGAYYIKVFDYAGNAFSQTPYTITATFTPRSTVYFLDEPNDASNQPTSLGLNQPYQSYIYRPTHASPSDYGNNYGGDADWYQLSVTQAGKLEILVTAVPGINMMAELFRNPTDGAIASGGYSSLFGQSASLVPVYIDPSQVGAYYIKVFDYAGNAFSQTPYTITATFTPRSTVYFLDEPNDASNQPTSLGLNQPYQSYIYRPTHASASDYGNNYGGDTDWYQLSLTQSGKLEISVTGVPGINMMAYLFRNPTDTVAIASGGYSSLFGQSASLVPVYIDPSQVGAYYIKVFDYAGNAFSQTPYTITAGFLPDLRVDSISPNQGDRGDSLGITITGSDLLGVSSLSFGVGIAVESFSASSDSQITGTITIDALAALGARDVTVTGAEGTATLADGFIVGQPQPEMIWYLDSETHSPTYVMEPTMSGQSGDVSIPAKVGDINGEVIWYSNNAAVSSVTFPAGVWTIRLETPEDWADQCLLSIGIWDPDGTPAGFLEFPANPPSKSYAGGILTVHMVTNASGTVPTGAYLALKVRNSGGVSHSVTTDGDSRLQAPDGSPSYPVPEVPAVLLFGLGCGVIVAFVLLGRMTGKGGKPSAPVGARR